MPKNATYLDLDLWGTPLGLLPRAIHILESSHRAKVKPRLQCNAATYPFLDIRSQCWPKTDPLPVPIISRAKRRRAKLHADQLHRRRDICPRTKKK